MPVATDYVYSLALYWDRRKPRRVTPPTAALQYSSRPDLDEELGGMFRLTGDQAGELMLVRHAEPDTGARHRYCGDEPALTVTGRVQAHFLASRLTEARIDAVYSAPERYVEETARIVSEAAEAPMRIVPELADVGYAADGSDGGVDIAGLFADNPIWDALPGFESSAAFRRRVTQAIERLLAAHGAQRIVIVTHTSVINAYLGKLLDIGRDLFFYPDHVSLSAVRWQESSFAVRSLNDTSHIATASRPWRARSEV
jgi:broad specificity phosphatase PhoE